MFLFLYFFSFTALRRQINYLSAGLSVVQLIKLTGAMFRRKSTELSYKANLTFSMNVWNQSAHRLNCRLASHSYSASRILDLTSR